MPRVFGEVVGLESSSPALWRAKDGTGLSSDSETARGQGNGPDCLNGPHHLTPEESSSERSRVSTEVGELTLGFPSTAIWSSPFPLASHHFVIIIAYFLFTQQTELLLGAK